VTKVDTSSKQIVLTDYTNTSRTVDISDSLEIRIGTYIDNNLFSIKPDDRVEIVQEEDGKTTITVIQGERRTVDSYNSTTRTLNMKRRTLTDTTSYPLHERVIVRQGSSVLNPTALKYDDIVTIYLL